MKTAYLATSNGSGPVYRGLALYKAWLRTGNNPKDFSLIVASPYSWLLRYLAPGANLFLSSNGNLNPQVMLDSHIEKVKPDALIVSQYGYVRHRVENCKNYLLVRQAIDYTSPIFDGFNHDVWQAVIAIDPGIKEAIASYTDAIEVNPVLATCIDELLPQDKARSELLKIANIRDRDLPLQLVAHNGVSSREMMVVLAQAQSGYQNLYFSQDGIAFGFKHTQPLAQYFQGVDSLVASPGYNTFWEWQLYGREGANVRWVVQPRYNENQAYRLELEIDRQALRKAPNGADMIINEVIKDAT